MDEIAQDFGIFCCCSTRRWRYWWRLQRGVKTGCERMHDRRTMTRNSSSRNLWCSVLLIESQCKPFDTLLCGADRSRARVGLYLGVAQSRETEVPSSLRFVGALAFSFDSYTLRCRWSGVISRLEDSIVQFSVCPSLPSFRANLSIGLNLGVYMLMSSKIVSDLPVSAKL